MKTTIWRERLVFFVLGAVSLCGMMLLLGAASDYQNSTLNFGRYQLSSWATQVDGGSGVIGAFVLDTVSGETRTAYIRTYGDVPKTHAVKNSLKQPFNSM